MCDAQDGETNLKVRHPADLAGCATDSFRSIMQIRAVLECDPPSNSLHTFNGLLTILSCGGGAQPGGAHSNDGAEDRKGHWDHGSLFASLQQQSGKSALLQPLSDAAASAGGEAASGGRSSISSAGAQSEAHQASSAALPPAGAQQPEQQGDEEAPPPAQPVGAAQAPATAPAQQGQAQGPAQRKAQQEQKAGREEQKAGGGEEQKEGREKQQKEGGGEEEQDSAEALKARVEQEAQRLALPRRAVNMNGMLLRGCELRNSRWALGLVVYAGPETRIQMNALAPPLKVGSFDRFLNVQISIIILVQLALCLASALAGYAWRQTAGLKRYYMALDEPGHGNFQNPATYLSLTAITFWVLYSYLVPLSLFVTLEIVRFWQAAIFINSDPKLVCTETGEAARARNSSLNEDLARVEYIFADKTGTLTRNDMR